MIDVKYAIKSAISFAEDNINVGSSGSPLEALRVEEVDYSGSENTWLITLGWNDKDYKEYPSSIPMLRGDTVKVHRAYKVFHVDAEDGTVKRMKMREA